MSTCSNTKPTQVIVATFITFFLLLLSKVKSYDDLSFQFKKFKPNGMDLILQGHTSISEGGVLRLSKVENGQPIFKSFGRAGFGQPVHIWENNKVASFVTRFSFRMEAPNKHRANGLTFFLAPPDHPFPPSFKKGATGACFGLFRDTTCDSSYHIVAVEFDTHGEPNNPWDPSYPHIGIDVNCCKSTKTVQWNSRYGGEVANVEIRYEASTKTLTASLTYPSDNKSFTVSDTVDLKAILPEWVRVGFSAATAWDTFRETHDVLNWSFNSTLEAKNNVALDNNALEIENNAYDTA